MLHAVERAAPEYAASKAFEWWCRPMRVKKLRAPKEGRAFSIETTEGVLRAWEWGLTGASAELPRETVLLVHGWSASSVVMERCVAPLVAAGKHVVAFDLPSHGLTPGSQTNVVQLSRAIEAVVARVRPTAIIAHSLGATATAIAVARGPSVERVVLLAPGTRMTYFAHAFTRRAGFSDAMGDRLLEEIVRRVGLHPETLDLVRHAPPAQTQVLIVHDPADDEVPWAHGAELVKAWPNTSLVAAPGVGHHGMPRRDSVVEASTQFVLTGAVPGPLIHVLEQAA